MLVLTQYQDGGRTLPHYWLAMPLDALLDTRY
jgi:hypothetical protein